MVTTTDQQPQTLSLEEFLQQQETKPATEFFYGNLTQKPMPTGKHSRLQSRLAREIDQRTEESEIALALTELRCTFGGRSLVPDIAVIRWENLPWDEDETIGDRFEQCPDWVIEILSPQQPQHLVMEKILFCLQHGTMLGWLIDPYVESVTVFKKDQAPTLHLSTPLPDTQDLALPMLDGLEDWQLYAKDLFGWLKRSTR
ncbi:protein of unknown function DUF820 [[Leptolyngbya] sp. PCC 7376]|uniref:Uma2 family endonuclease n=1 Tax=[Leptolyngbya] sp. PCC 7376 TaxID=111781 RepID=UPI00029ECE28|nr:Uma2 family endonuclease [[Leptolyngbya] sp. PCC 7376]AFY37617.1 protein of unknown function DUF820 [[Leptolyngbya] sp. PCC 7376]